MVKALVNATIEDEWEDRLLIFGETFDLRLLIHYVGDLH
jgi:hypothetical protein